MWLFLLSGLAMSNPSSFERMSLRFYPHYSKQGIEPWSFQVDENGKCWLGDFYRGLQGQVVFEGEIEARLSKKELEELEILVCHLDLERPQEFSSTLTHAPAWVIEVSHGNSVHRFSVQGLRWHLWRSGYKPVDDQLFAFGNLMQWLVDRAGNRSSYSSWHIWVNEWRLGRKRMVGWGIWSWLLLINMGLAMLILRRWTVPSRRNPFSHSR